MKNSEFGCGAILVGAPLILAVILAEGFVLSKLWLWHAVPLGMRVLPWTVFVAAALALSVLKNSIKRGQPDTDTQKESAVKLVFFLVWPWLCLAVGWWLK